MSSYYVSSGVTSTGVPLFYNDYLYVSSAGMASDTTVNYGCYLIVSEGGMADVIRVNSRGVLQVYSGGTATNIDWTPCVGWLYLDPGAQATFTNEYSGVYYGANDQLTGSAEVWDSSMIGDDWRVCVMNGGIATNTYVEYGDLEIYSGGVASSISMNWYGRCSVCSGGSANDATVGSKGTMIIGSGGIATSITDNGNLYVREGASADKIKVNGTLYVNSGGTATEIDWTPCVGGLSIEDGAHVTFTSEYSGVYYGEYGQSKSHAPTMENMNLASGSGMFVMADGVANNITIGEYGAEMIIWSGGVANDATGNGGNIRVSSGGIANNAEINANCYFSVSSGGTANNTTVNQYGHLVVSSGGTADKTKVKGWGRLEVYSGGTATDVDWTPCEGYVIVSEGALVTFANEYSGVYYGKDHQLLSSAMTMSGIAMDGSYPEMYVMNGGMADNITVKGWGQFFISSGGTANEAIVSSGYMYVCSGGVANNAAVIPHGSMVLDSGGVASNTTVSYRGNLYVSSGGKLTGRMVFENGVSVSAYEGSIVDFDLSGHSPFGVKLVDNLSAIHGNPLYTLTVSGAETTGSYRLAGNAADFNETITVVNTSGVELGTLAVADGTKEIGGVKYALTLNKKNVLSVMVGEFDPNVFTGELTSETKEIKAGSSAFCVDVNISGLLKTLKGGTADYTTVNEYGQMHVSKGGTARDTEVNSGGSMYVSKGGTARDTEVSSGGSMYVSKGGTASDTTVNSRGSIIISKGGKATKTTVSSGGSMIISKGTVSGATIVSSGYFVMSGGTINGLTIDRGSGVVSSGGGTINDLTINEGYLPFYSGTINRATVDHGGIYVYSGGKLKGATFNGGTLSLESGTANKITLENGAHINVYRSGKASNVMLEGGASAYVESGAVVTNLTLTGGDADPEKDQYTARLVNYGTVKGLKIGSGTSVGLSSGCTVTKLTWTPGDGVVNIGDASLSFTSKYSGVYIGSGGTHVSQTKEFLSSSLARGESAYVMKGGYANANELKGGKMEVWNGGKAENIFIGNDGDNSSWVDVSSGGTMTSARVSGGFLNLEGGFVGDTVIGSEGELYVSGGSASGIRVEAGGALYLYNCTATDVDWTPFVGDLGIGDDAHVTFKTAITGIYVGNSDTLLYHTEETLQDWSVNQGSNTLFVMSGGEAENTAVLGSGGMYVFGGSVSGTTIGGENGEGYGYMLLYDEAYASDTVIHSGGQYVYSGGLAVSTTVGSMGYMYVFNSGTAEDVMISSGASMYVSNGGSAAGIRIQARAALSVSEGGHADVVSAAGGYYRQGGYVYVSSGAVVSNLQLEYGAVLYVEKGAKVVNVQSSYGSLIRAEKGASVKKITLLDKTESPDSDHDEKNGWADKKNKTINSYILNSEAFVIDDNYWSCLPFDEKPTTYDSYSAYVGYTDEADFLKVHLEDAAKLSFSVSATDESKFTVWKYDEKTKKLKSLQATTLKLSEFSGGKSKSSSDTYYYAQTLGLLLDEGEYFLSMESTNAAKGGNAYYDVYFSERTFFDHGDNMDDKGDVLREKLHADDPEYKKYDVGTLDGSEEYIMDDWVGYGDEIDFRRFSLDHGAKLSFNVYSDDVTKFTVWKYDEKKQKLVSVQTTNVKETKSKLSKKSASCQATTKELQLGPGEYFFSVESTNAKKGANAYYSVYLNPYSDFATYAGGDNSDDWTDLAENGTESTMYGNVGELGLGSRLPENWVGFGDEFDYAEFSVGEDAKLSFAIKSDDSVILTVFTLSETAKGWKQNVLATKTLKTKNGKVITETTAEFDVAAGGETRYFYSVQSLNAKKGKAGATYALSVDLFNGMKVIHLGVEKKLMSVADAAALAMPETASVASALSMPETDSLADSLAMPDSLSFGQYDTDVLADTSLDPASDKLFGETGNGLLASL